MYFELNSKIAIDSFHSNMVDLIEFGDIMCNYMRIFSPFKKKKKKEHRVEFVKRQANEIVYLLTNASTSLASFQIYVNVQVIDSKKLYLRHII